MNYDENAILYKIKSRGYWRIEIQPVEYKKSRFTLSDCERILQKSQIMKRGWPYPYIYEIGQSAGSKDHTNDYFTTMIDWGQNKEILRMYPSGQFIHYLALLEDWNERMLEYYKEKKILEIVITLYSITEIFLFISNLAQNDSYGDNIYLKIELNDTYNRQLEYYNTPFVPFRLFDHVYECKSKEPITLEEVYNTNDIFTNYATLAMDTISKLFEKFNWNSSNIKEILRDDQEKILKGII